MGKIKLGIIGSGNIVKNFLDASNKLDDCEIFAFYSRSLDTAIDFQKKYNIPNIYTDLDEMARNPELDAVYIASPNSLHYIQSIKIFKKQEARIMRKGFCVK